MANSTVAARSYKGLPEVFEIFEECNNDDGKKGIAPIDNFKSLNGFIIYRTIHY